MSNTIKAHIRQGEQSGFVAECVELPVVTQGQTLDEVITNLRKAIILHLETEELIALGLTTDSPIAIAYEIELPLSSSRKSAVSWFKKGIAYKIAGVIVFILWVTAPFAIYGYFADWSKGGQFGDLFGSVNALFSGLAFVALIYTIHLQRQELSLQRTELKLQREEMAASRGELAAQVAVQKSLHSATIGQIRVAAEQARIQAWSLEFERKKNTYESGLLKNINNAADKIEVMAKNLESG